MGNQKEGGRQLAGGRRQGRRVKTWCQGTLKPTLKFDDLLERLPRLRKAAIFIVMVY